MRIILLVLICYILIFLMNYFLKKTNKQIQKEHFIFGYLLITYLIINVLLIVGTTSLSELEIGKIMHKTMPNLQNVNLIPFNDSLNITSLCNIILFMPFGFLLPVLWEKYCRLRPTFFYGFIFSLIIEISQLFTINRTCDVNDLIFNTLGTICGWAIFKVLSKPFSKLVSKTMIKSEQNTTITRVEPYLYVIIIFAISFFQ